MNSAIHNLTPHRMGPDDPALCNVLSLIRTTFAYMEGRIDPPSSTHQLTLEELTEQAKKAEVWVMEDDDRVVACVFLTPKKQALYLGKLAVAVSHRGHGLARKMVALAQERARALGFSVVELQSRLELTENHSAFAALGFRVVDETAHPGFEQPTSLTFVLSVSERSHLHPKA